MTMRSRAHWCVIARFHGRNVAQRFVRTRTDAQIAAEGLRQQHPGATIVMRCARPPRPGDPTRWRYDSGRFEVAARKPEPSAEELF